MEKTNLSPFAGRLPGPEDLADIPKLLAAYNDDQPDPKETSQRVLFGTSGHRGSSFERSFNRNHILVMTQAVCAYRKKSGVTGPLFLGYDTHALSLPAFQTTLEVLAANSVEVMIAPNEEFTPTPAISHAILCYNKARKAGLSDGIVLTPSHNPPDEGGFKYNPTHGGPAGSEITDWIQTEANRMLDNGLSGVQRVTFEQARRASTTHLHDYLNSYVKDLGSIIDMEVIRGSKIKIGVDPLGGAGVHYWQPIADLYNLDLSVINPSVDPCFRFMPRDWDGKIRMDPSSPYAMATLIKSSRKYDITFACDTDHDRHGIVAKSCGLVPANHYLCVAISYLFKNRPLWNQNLQIGKTLVSSQLIDRVGKSLQRSVYEVPVGFKWFVDGLLQDDSTPGKVQLGFGGEESAGASFRRKNGDVWTTDKDGIVPSLLSAEMTAKLGKDPGELYNELTDVLGNPFYKRIDAPADASQRNKLKNLSKEQIRATQMGGEKIERITTRAPANDAPIGGVKVETENGWIAVRPSGTENIYKIYGESFLSEDHLQTMLQDARVIADEGMNLT